MSFLVDFEFTGVCEDGGIGSTDDTCFPGMDTDNIKIQYNDISIYDNSVINMWKYWEFNSFEIEKEQYKVIKEHDVVIIL